MGVRGSHESPEGSAINRPNRAFMLNLRKQVKEVPELRGKSRQLVVGQVIYYCVERDTWDFLHAEVPDVAGRMEAPGNPTFITATSVTLQSMEYVHFRSLT